MKTIDLTSSCGYAYLIHESRDVLNKQAEIVHDSLHIEKKQYDGMMQERVKDSISFVRNYPLVQIWAYLGLLVAAISWGFVPAFQKKLLIVFSPAEVTFSRFVLAGVILFFWILLTRFKEFIRMVKSDFYLLALSTIIGPLTAMVLFNYSLGLIPIGVAAVVIAVEPILTYLFAVIARQERWDGKRLRGFLVAM